MNGDREAEKEKMQNSEPDKERWEEIVGGGGDEVFREGDVKGKGTLLQGPTGFSGARTGWRRTKLLLCRNSFPALLPDNYFHDA